MYQKQDGQFSPHRFCVATNQGAGLGTLLDIFKNVLGAFGDPVFEVVFELFEGVLVF